MGTDNSRNITDQFQVNAEIGSQYTDANKSHFGNLNNNMTNNSKLPVNHMDSMFMDVKNQKKNTTDSDCILGYWSKDDYEDGGRPQPEANILQPIAEEDSGSKYRFQAEEPKTLLRDSRQFGAPGNESTEVA